MGGGLLQLVAYGAQDVYLTGNPQITFFKVVYRRHTNFAIEAIQQTFNGNPTFGSTVTCQISRNGDLINRAYLEVKVFGLKPDASTANTCKYVNYLGLRLIKSVLIEIGGQQIDKHYSDWMYIWNELSLPIGKRYGYDTMVGADSDIVSDVLKTNTTTLYIPLEFWFCRNVGLALPLIALQYHEVKIKLTFEEKANCVSLGSDSEINSIADFKDASIWIDYIFLDTDERRRFAQLSHEYLIEQLQFSSESGSSKIKLNFNHPCKELVWVAVKKSLPVDKSKYWYNYSDIDAFYNVNTDSIPGSLNNFAVSVSNHIATTIPSGENPFNNCLLQLNGNDRFAARNGKYFNLVQQYQHHTNISMNKGINVYSFALKPEEHQPSGTLNMSRIDAAVLSVSTNTLKNSASASVDISAIKIFAVNYNVLRILSGMGGLAYSN